ncbi:uncharacterized protein METZ01_LOCUS499885, partial [marine metagenome]
MVLIFYLASESIVANEPIALITKSRGNAKLATDGKYRKYAVINTPIFHGNRIKT